MAKKAWLKFWPVFFIVVILGIFWGCFLRNNKVLLPADLLVGAYYPWRENNFGYPVAVPYKNPLLSDSYSQFFVWKKIIADSYKEHEIPLWNWNSYGGYPLAANLHSTAYNPLNIVFFISDFIHGWNLYLILGIFGSSLTMLMLLKYWKFANGPSIVGSLIYSLSLYSLSWMEMATAGHSMIWIPVLVLLTDIINTKNSKLFLWLPMVWFLLISTGNFQMIIYGGLISFLYGIYKSSKNNKLRFLLIYGLMAVIGLGISSVIVLPTAELTSLSIRESGNAMALINYGLVPLSNLVTFVFPDFFGNPATNNFWGFENYHESIVYAGVVGLIAVVWSLLNFKKLKSKYWVVFGLTSLLFYFDNPLGKWFYGLNLPLISTTTAGRNSYLLLFSVSILVAEYLSSQGKQRLLSRLKPFGYVLMFSLIIFLTLKITGNYLHSLNSDVNLEIIKNISVAIRNMYWPVALLVGFGLMIGFLGNRMWCWVLIIVFVLADSGRIVKKYLPISEEKYVFPNMEVFNYLNRDDDQFRVEKEYGPLLSPNTWSWYDLKSSSGYDPMALKSYILQYNKVLNKTMSLSRYAELKKYDARELGDFGVKYLMVLKRDKDGKIGGDNIDYTINSSDWKKVFESKTVALLENKYFHPIYEVFKGKVNNFVQKTNMVTMNVEAEEPSQLIIRNTFYPGWNFYVNGVKVAHEPYNEIFCKINIDGGVSKVEVKYEPISFLVGSGISIIFLLFNFILVIFNKIWKRKRF